MRARILLLAFVFAGGCHWALNDPGTNPPKDELYFPAGIAIDPATQFAYVSNANADLKYGGGTVQMYDVQRFECAVAAFRFDHFTEDLPEPLKTLCNLDESRADAATALCQMDPRDRTVIDCNEKPFVLGESTVKVGNFAGVVRLMKHGTGHRVFVGVRGDPSITWIDATLPAQRNAPERNLLDCFEPGVGPSGSPPGCHAGSHLVQDYECMNLPSCLNRDEHGEKTQLPSEPFGMAFDDPTNPKQLLVAHLASGQVALINQLDGAKPLLAAVSVSMFPASGTGLRGAFALAPRPLDGPSPPVETPPEKREQPIWYLTSNLNSIIATFRIALSNEIVPTQQFTIQPTFLNGNDVREIIFDKQRKRAFLTDAIPPTVVTLDTTLIKSAGGSIPANTVTSVVDVCQTPSHMGLRRIAYPDGTVRNKLVVVCFLSSQVMIVDPDRPGVDDTIFGGLGGPNDLAFTFDDDDAAVVPAVEPLRHAWITNFTESTISVVDLDPRSPTQNQVIARLGFPPDGTNTGIK